MVFRHILLISASCWGLFGTPAAFAKDDVAGMVAAAAPAAGKKLFLRCKACHTTEKNGPHRLGPNLWDVVGRSKASAKGFRYSKALLGVGGSWDFTALDSYLENPKKFAPGNRMAFAGLKNAAQRAAVIAYLRTLSDQPVALPVTAAKPSTEQAALPEQEENFGGLPAGAGREETYAICGACHSLQIVTQQGLNADRWDGLMDWMTEKQGMAELEKAERRRIVTYLARFYGPDRRARQSSDPMRPAMPSMPMMAPMPMAPPMPKP